MKAIHTRVALSVLLFGAMSLFASDWVIENASGLRWFEHMQPRHLAVNAFNRPCTAFGGDQLYYCEKDAGGVWQVSIVDEARGVGTYASLALQGGHHPRIAYSDDSTHALKYAAWKLDGLTWKWNIEQVSDTGGRHCSLVLGNDGAPHIAYSAGLGNLYYVQKGVSGWSIPERIGLSGNGEDLRPSLVLDSGGGPHVLSARNSDKLDYVRRDGGEWVTTQISSRAQNLVAPCARTTTDFIHCVFFEKSVDFFVARIRYISFAVGTPGILLIDETVENVTAPEGASLSLDMLPSGQPHVAYTIPGDENIHHVVRTGANAWSATSLPCGSGVQPSSVSIALNSVGRAFVSYRAEHANQFTMESREQESASSWGAVAGYTYGYDASEHVDLAVLGYGTPLIAYRQPMSGQMIMRERTAEYGWVSYASDVDGDCGAWVSIAAAEEHPREVHAAYYVADGGNLRYQRSHGYPVSGPTLLDEVGDVGKHASLAVNPVTARPAIAYMGTTNGLKYVSQVALPPNGLLFWNTQTVDDTSDTGEYAALAFNAEGHPFIGYRSGPNGDVRVASNTGSGWAWEVVLSGLDPEHIAMDIDGDDEPHLSFINALDGQLWHAWRASGTWNWQAVTGADYSVGHTSILIDSAGNPSILYLDYTNSAYAIRVARRRADGVTWDIENIFDPEGRIGANTRAGCLIRGPDERPMACFYDAIERDIMVAEKVPMRIVSMTQINPDVYELEWSGEDHNLWIDRSPTLNPPVWTPVAGPLHGTNHWFSGSGGKMFYRLRTP